MRNIGSKHSKCKIYGESNSSDLTELNWFLSTSQFSINVCWSTRELRFPRLLPTSVITIVGFLCADMLAIARLLDSCTIKGKKKLALSSVNLTVHLVIVSSRYIWD